MDEAWFTGWKSRYHNFGRASDPRILRMEVEDNNNIQDPIKEFLERYKSTGLANQNATEDENVYREILENHAKYENIIPVFEDYSQDKKELVKRKDVIYNLSNF